MAFPHPNPYSTAPFPEAAQQRSLGYFIFLSRWLQLPLYLGLIVAQAAYVWQFLRELWDLVHGLFDEGNVETNIMLSVLGLIDVVMISNLLIMVIVGGYETFVSRLRIDGHPDQPEWLAQVNANVLKVKLAMSIVGISSIHLLKTFISITTDTNPGAHSARYMWPVIIHLAFVLSAVLLAWIDRIMPHAAHKDHHAAHAEHQGGNGVHGHGAPVPAAEGTHPGGWGHGDQATIRIN
ncbi:TIGR00645 family protein [Nocardia sp. CDC160]|uniref:TIGR00645 family protein n=1 Tax=Nocardia sp. CDC160 TaxID=3112166 RepID=UPI002DBCACEF|nr:TIGR00645 family protein [Nocardia sp. CDC160]MEC3915895.1 TIGR00645 family protein [Nocardia sp. CDC160]